MDFLYDAFRHNAWANRRVFEAAKPLTPAQLAEPIPGIYGSAIVTANHLVQTEDRYITLILGGDWRPAPAVDIEELAATLAERDAQFVKYVDGLSGDALERTFAMPSLQRDVRVGDGLLQVLNHSTEHRADMASAITRLGGTPPLVDYLAFALDLPDNNK